MSNGSQIGGALGAVVGTVVGFYTGNPLAGAQYGYAIGSAIGGYVDPVKTQGPRITDAQAQTSSVGGIIPFGFGAFTTAGNIIWRDELKEHKKTERVGKGGSQKNTTYTYTRSYAIGVCKGVITRFIWVKKNGKLVYAADPVALGGIMGWSSKQISDLQAASAKFLQSHTIYYGTDDQMPDSTISAVEGPGNVSPFRDLAYIVAENVDLTAMQGAIDQHEFCVFRGFGKAYTTPPYAVLASDSLDTPSESIGANVFVIEPGEADLSSVALDGELSETLLGYSAPPEAVDLSSVALAGTIADTLLRYEHGEAADISSVAINGTQEVTLLQYQNYDPESQNVSSIALGGTLS